MEKFILKSLFKKNDLHWAFIVLCSVFTSINAFSIKDWGRDCCSVNHRLPYNDVEENIEIYFKFFDSDFTTEHEHGYMQNLSASYSINGGKSFYNLFSAGTKDQENTGFSWLTLKNKMKNAHIQFSTNPNHLRVERWKEIFRTELIIKAPNHSQHHNQTWICMKWFTVPLITKVTHIRLHGIWFVNGVMGAQFFTEIFEIHKQDNMCMNSSIETGLTFP